MVPEEPMVGGNMGVVTRRGDEVLRPAGPWSATVHRLLQLYADAGITETPRPLGFTADGRERLTFLPGTVANDPVPPAVWAESVLDDAGHLLRRLHDASLPLAGLTRGWRSPVRQPAEVVCHNDFATYNLVFSNGRLTGVIDFDYASPGPRLWDLAYLAYRLVPLLGTHEVSPFRVSERQARLERLLEAYGSASTVDDLVAMAVGRLLDLAAFSERVAGELGNPELLGHAAGYRADADRLARGDLAER